MIQWSPLFCARVCSANASDPEAGSERQKDPSCSTIVSYKDHREPEALHLGLSKLRKPFILLFLRPIFPQDGIHQGVVDIAHNRNRGINFGKFFDRYYSRHEGRLSAPVSSARFDSHELFGQQRIKVQQLDNERTTYPLFKKPIDNLRVHAFLLIHFTDFGRDDFVSKPLH